MNTNLKRDKAGLQPGEVGTTKSNSSRDDNRPDAPLQGQLVEIVTDKSEPQIDSRIIADFLGVKHQNTFELIKDYTSDFEQFGKLRFKTGACRVAFLCHAVLCFALRIVALHSSLSTRKASYC